MNVESKMHLGKVHGIVTLHVNVVISKGNNMVTTTQVAKLRKKKGVETILVDYK